MADFIEGIASPQSNYEKYKDMFTDKHDLITMENFYSLLVAEMQNQDPLEPTSNTEFISQMASFTALSAQQDAFEVQQQSYANSLIGKTVTVSLGDGKTETGVVSYVKSGNNPQVNVNGTNYNLSAIAQVHESTQAGAAIGDYGAFAAGILGKTAVVGAVDATGASYVDEGVVESIEIENGNVRVIVNGYAYDATDVLRVSETKESETTQTAQAAQATQATQATQSVQDDDDDDPVSTAAAAQIEQATQTTAAQQTDEDDIADASDDGNDDSQIYELFE